MQISAISIVYCAIGGGAVGALFGRSYYGVGQGIGMGTIVYVANRCFGRAGFYGGIALNVIVCISKLGELSKSLREERERANAAATRSLLLANRPRRHSV